MRLKKPAQRKLDITINLVPQDPFFETGLGRFLKWALSVGRYIVIFTELIVILSFATRFTLDRMVTDLNSAISQKERVIQSYGELESNFRFVQRQIEDYNQFKQEANLIDIFPILNENVPRDVVFETLLIRPDSINFTGGALSQDALNVLVNNLQLSPYFTQISVNKIESRGEKVAGFNFDMKSNINLNAEN
jgi:Tfp pilus assembly protein PilN